MNNKRYFSQILDGASQKAERSFTIIELLREGVMISLRDVCVNCVHLNGSIVAIILGRIELRIIS